jgi:RNA polymerase sigma factor (sigma-70 family)
MNEISQETIMRAAGGDMEAFEAIYKASSGFVYNVALKMVRKTTEAEEITQDVFVKIYKSLKDFEFKSSFKTWAYRITVNTALNRCRQAEKDREAVEMEDMSIIPAKKDDLKERIDDEDSTRKADLMLSVLNPEQRACIVLRELEGLGYGEIANALNIPVNTVRSRLKRGRETLAAYFRKGVVSHEVR